jgi:molybdopterin molybdotransferase
MAKTWGKVRHRLFRVDEAQTAVADGIEPIGSERVALEAAQGRILAVPVINADDYPAFNKAMMDGFAVRAADCATSGARLKVVGFVPAGGEWTTPLGAAQAVQINTGAPVPAGADAVVRVEDTTISGDVVTVATVVKPHQCMTLRGSDRRKGETVLTPPLTIGPAHIAAAATAGAAMLEVAREVGVAIVSTGDELVPPGTARKAGQIFDSNGPMLAALMRQFGASPRNLGVVRDDEGELTERLREALREPVVLTVGGMSMGTLDLVPRAFESLGVRWLFHGVEVRPGKPVAYGRGPDGQHVFGLPGNPVSAFVCSWLFARMAIRGLQGFRPEPPPRLRALLSTALTPHRDSRPAYVPARVWNDAGRGLTTEPCPWSGSADPFGLAMANALLVRDDPTKSLAEGDAVEIILTES